MRYPLATVAAFLHMRLRELRGFRGFRARAQTTEDYTLIFSFTASCYSLLDGAPPTMDLSLAKHNNRKLPKLHKTNATAEYRNTGSHEQTN
jgi:hypothetical protein